MIDIYTDGAYSPSRNKGGWAFVVIFEGEKVDQRFFFEFDTTNNRMEIQAVIEACLWLIEHKLTIATIYTDSMYVIGTMTKQWKRNKNNDLWEILDKLVSELSLTWKHVKGHSGDVYNSLCDALAVTASL